MEGQGEIAAYRGDNPLFGHGGLRVAADHRHFAHADGTHDWALVVQPEEP